MRTLIVALGIAALASTPALAQISRGSVSGPGIGTSGTTGTTTSGTSTTTTTGTTSTGSLPAADSLAASPTTTNATTTTTTSTPTGAGNGFGTNTTTDINAATPGNSFAPGGPFSNDSGNTALGTSPGQTSSGTLAGNSSNGIGADSSGLNNGLANNGNFTLVPEGSVSVIGGGGSGARLVGVPNAVSPQGAAPGSTPTPLFDQAAREGRAKEARRRERGEEPRIYGIAPNTERDLTYQMPDDRIIRY